MELSRYDIAADALYPGASGLLSIITDPTHKVMYYIQRETRNCTIEPFQIPVGGGGIVVDPNGTYHIASLEGLFYLVNTSEYTYVGNFSAHGVVLDNWTYTGDIEQTNLSYHNVTVDILIARNGAPSTYSSNKGPVPWRISLRGEVTVSKQFNVSLSTVVRMFDMSFEQPDYDVFDISVCAEPKDYLVLVMAVPKNMNQVDYSSYRKNVRQAVVGYTQVLPIQVGAIEVSRTRLHLGRGRGGVGPLTEILTTLSQPYVDPPLKLSCSSLEIANHLISSPFSPLIDLSCGDVKVYLLTSK